MYKSTLGTFKNNAFLVVVGSTLIHQQFAHHFSLMFSGISSLLESSGSTAIKKKVFLAS